MQLLLQIKIEINYFIIIKYIIIIKGMETLEITGYAIGLFIILFFGYICLTSLKINNTITTQNNQNQV